VETNQAIADKWLVRILRPYPDQGARFFSTSSDSFQNPVGHLYRESSRILVDELLGPMDTDRVTAAIRCIVELRAVLELPPSVALAFLFELKEILGDGGLTSLEVYYRRIDEVALIAFETYVRCRERICEARIHEVQRSVSALKRALELRDPSVVAE
jgi:hypothetical protein